MQYDLEILLEAVYKAPRQKVWKALVDGIGEWMVPPDTGVSMKLKIEPWPGGRFYRDLGEGMGHLWGHVQVIKPPGLLEIYGPLAMSFPVVSHVAFRLEDADAGTRLRLAHRATGPIDETTKEGMRGGWQGILEEGLRGYVEAKATA